MSPEKLWEDVLGVIQKEISKPSYETWLVHLKPIAYKNDTFYIQAKDSRTKAWIEDRYRSVISKEMERITGRSVNVVVTLTDESAAVDAINWSELKDEAISFVMEAAERIRTVEREQLHIDTKQDADDLVTDKDIEVQRILTEKVTRNYPNHDIVGEEGDEANVDPHAVTWFIDPIDGTTNFVHQAMNYAISIGIYQGGVGHIGIIYDVQANEWFTAVRGQGAYVNGKRLPNRRPVRFDQAIIGFNARWLVGRADEKMKDAFANIVREVRAVRSYGSAALESAYVAAGRLDAYVSLRLSPWDYAAAAVLLEETGGACCQLDGGVLHFDRECTYLAADEQVKTKMLAYLNET
ncbi:inositol monophosphatase family protein [Geomicrobium sp. JSM 1781026]|uniref:inositol monophosphatase family protein n=1 Tax=Geomicrobium sp. JSM 1781026 TaxID=3344580 RepID=UPI0035BEF647